MTFTGSQCFAVFVDVHSRAAFWPKSNATLWPSFLIVVVDWKTSENKTITRNFHFNQKERNRERERGDLSDVSGIAKLAVLCCKWHLSNMIIIQNVLFPRALLWGANRRLLFNQQRLGGDQEAGAGGSVGGTVFGRRAACEGPASSLQPGRAFNSAGCCFPAGVITELKPHPTLSHDAMSMGWKRRSKACFLFNRLNERINTEACNIWWIHLRRALDFPLTLSTTQIAYWINIS